MSLDSSRRESSNPIDLSDDGAQFVAAGPTYTWTWSRDDDRFCLSDSRGRTVASGPLQPVVVVDDSGAPLASSGTVSTVSVHACTLRVTYTGVNGTGSCDVSLDFAADQMWMAPVRYRDPDGRRVRSMHQFATHGADADQAARPALEHTYLVQPGLCESSGVSPILTTEVGLHLTSWIGRGSMGVDSQIYQQWGLPSHYFCGVSRNAGHNAHASLAALQSSAFCCGLADLPNADVTLQLGTEATSLGYQVRADLWQHLPAGSEQILGARLVWTLGTDYRDAIRNYYRALRDTATISIRDRSVGTLANATASQFNTWGAQCALEKTAGRFDQATLEQIYAGVKASGLRPEMFVLDDKWEGAYGLLKHDAKRFPDFDAFLARVREDGLKVGLWAAFLRVNDPHSVGLAERHLMCDASGKPIEKNNDFAREPFYLFDVSQAEVREMLSGTIAAFVKRYDPDLVKFDFGYELPSLALAAPADPSYAGEQLLRRGLEFLVSALRAAKPDIAILYDSLSPLFVDLIDQHGHDDMYLNIEEYAEENNRRLFFSSLLGELGIPIYGSGGYDWHSMPDIWRDNAIAGPVGSLNSVAGDEHCGGPTPEQVARYNGLVAITRRSQTYQIDPLSRVTLGSTTGARSDSWVRREGGVITSVSVGLPGRPLPDDAGVQSHCRAVVSSLTADGLATSDLIGIVAFDPGTMMLRTRPGRDVHVIQHLADRSSRTVVASSSVDWIELDVTEPLASVVQTEWFEVRFADPTPCQTPTPNEGSFR